MALHAHNLSTGKTITNNVARVHAEQKTVAPVSIVRNAANGGSGHCAGVRLSRGTRRLSARQSEVYTLRLQGLLVREIADELGVTMQRVSRVFDELRRKGYDVPREVVR